MKADGRSFVPAPIDQVAGFTRVRPGESLAGVCVRFGQPVHAYRELVAANLDRELNLDGPVGFSATLAGLQEGDALFVPAWWAPGGRPDLEGNRGRIGDEVIDALMQLFPNPPPGVNGFQWAGLNKTLASWWRQKNPNAVPSSVSEVEPFASPLLEFYEAVGKDLWKYEAVEIPWGEVPWHLVIGLAQKAFPWTSVDHKAINKLLTDWAKPGQVKHAPPVTDWSQADLSKEELDKVKMGGKDVWAFLHRLRWDLLPDLQIAQKIGTYQYGQVDPTQWLSNQITAAFSLNDDWKKSQEEQDITDFWPGGNLDLISCGPGKVKIAGKCFAFSYPTGGQDCPQGTISYSGICITNPCGSDQEAKVDLNSGIQCIGGAGGTSIPGGIPGGDLVCPKGASQQGSSCNCAPLGPGFVYDPFANECVDCGPNTGYDAKSGQCFCLPGFIPANTVPGAPAGDNFYGCVKTGGTDPPPAVNCGPGTKLVNGQCVPVEIQKKTEEKQKDEGYGKFAVAGGVIIGLLAVGWAIFRKNRS